MLLKPNWDKIMKHTFNRCRRGHIYHKFNLEALGLDIQDFSQLRLSYNNLPIDTYYPIKNDQPVRFRKYARFTADLVNNKNFLVTQQHSNNFIQEVKDFRNQPRRFMPMDQNILSGPFSQLLAQILGLIVYEKPNIKQIDISTHQIRSISYPNIPSDNAPEGIHQDGADYIVSALVFNKENIRNDISRIYNLEKELLWETVLEPGDFIFQDDKNLWHDIKPFQNTGNYLGYRDILGFDFKIIK